MWFACCSGGARACRKAGKSISNYDQQNCLPEVKAARPEFVELGIDILPALGETLPLAR